MKKLMSVISLALVAALLCVALVSCGPAKTADEAGAALKENGYTVTVDGEKMVSAVKDDEYITINYCDDEETANKIYDEVVAAKEAAQAELEKAENELKEAQDKLDDMEDGFAKTAQQAVVDSLKAVVDIANKAADVEIGQSGNMVWMGTKQAVKDAR